MLLGRIIGEHKGEADRLVGADELSKDDYRALSAAGRIRCPDCHARLIHVSAVESAEHSNTRRVVPISVDGDTAKRVPHFRSFAIEDHIPGCDYRDDPHSAAHAEQLRKALTNGRTILVNINFSVGFEGMRNRFNAVANNGASGLWHVDAWKKQNPDAVVVPARDITDILHYLQVAKDLRGREGLHLLFFHNLDAVQSCARFVVADDERRLRPVVSAIFNRQAAARDARQFYGDTPRLFLFHASKRQQELGHQGRRNSEIWGQSFNISEPTTHRVKMGMTMLNPDLSNLVVLDRGASVWSVSTPQISAYEIKRLNALSLGQPVDKPEKPAFFALRTESRKSFGLIAAETPLPPRQLSLPLMTHDGKKPLPPASSRTAARRRTAAQVAFPAPRHT